MRPTTVISTILAIGAMAMAAPLSIEADAAALIARSPEPKFGVLGKLWNKVAGKSGKASSKVHPAPSPLQEALALGPDGRWIG